MWQFFIMRCVTTSNHQLNNHNERWRSMYFKKFMSKNLHNATCQILING